jgi:uncharacterized protein (DUF1330 family)
VAVAAYLIVYETVTDPSRFSRYVKSVDPVITRRGGRLVASGPPEVVEGEFPLEQALVFEWPTRQAASDFWHSGEYTEIKKLREGAAVIKAIIIEGIHLG